MTHDGAVTVKGAFVDTMLESVLLILVIRPGNPPLTGKPVGKPAVDAAVAMAKSEVVNVTGTIATIVTLTGDSEVLLLPATCCCT